jgi:hypothetical protein
VQGEVAAILAWLAGRADGEDRISEPVQIATGLLARLCGDRQVDEGGQRRRTPTFAITKLKRLGVLVLARYRSTSETLVALLARSSQRSKVARSVHASMRASSSLLGVSCRPASTRRRKARVAVSRPSMWSCCFFWGRDSNDISINAKLQR